MKLTQEIKKVIVEEWIKKGDEDYLDIEWNPDDYILNWKDRVKEIDRNIKSYAGELEIKRVTYAGYKRIMQEACTKYLKGKYSYVVDLISQHEANELFEDTNGVQKQWEEWYQDIDNLNRAGKTSKQLNTFYKKLKKVETKTTTARTAGK